ncbi:N-acetylmuramoyl-L-alanine amidase [Fructilactobacillus myrtifloralis]|uniref:N-acetylmuramoyl-L-alanine amidase n=1 Tax=Fructilactobacillus myrtifloralis TaxID=2940301 RepID=A0ABY5BQS9_9LACO|nr:N-acetylmuramoyl-L-alanine amidase [Fructilactobacillus myrtifloralis]USS85403.1 N-acetylmuramoyl-L-alanine amidase [Fructilactobacillus myrtifloralis]
MPFTIRNRRGLAFTLVVTCCTCLIIGIMLLRNNVAVHTNNLQIKAGPNLATTTIGTVNRGDRVQIITKKHQWAQVVYQHQKIGWVPNWLLTGHPHLKTAGPLAEATIVLDPGHGGSDSGALSNSNQPEKRYTLALAQQVAARLRAAGTNVIMVRDHDQTVALKRRPGFATKSQANLFVSFHFDSSTVSGSASGFTTYYYHPGHSKQLAQAVNQQLTGLGLENKGVQFGDYLVIRDTTVPAVLLEMGYINNQTDFQKIKSKAYQQKVATEVTAGLNHYLKTNY